MFISRSGKPGNEAPWHLYCSLFLIPSTFTVERFPGGICCVRPVMESGILGMRLVLNHLVKRLLFSFRSCAVSTAGSGDPRPCISHWEEHGYACQDCCNSCHIPEG